ncbi:DUF642 domain-containing protein [Okeania sp. SIO2B3]|uniref:DUF642 domain-containing protein n=1 Tax=Okeania sp. SIO2B3 TaxID=2607784 RepID=UPI0013C12141|nr:DUF642 domain-containing protein [Okeania sp. SIO2B3]NET44194.1 DUF642 domain-containing protein [Okeania sp. SIO2B3]
MKRILSWMMSVLLVFTFLNISPSSAIAAESNLVVNGSFENPEVTKDWKLAQGPSIEVQTGNAGKPYDGQKLVELDSYAVTKIYQDIPTEVGKTYTLTFAFSPRPDVTDNKLNVYWGDTSLVQLSKSGSGLSDTKWEVYTYKNLKATSTTTRLSFDNLNEKSDSVGSYIDAISLVANLSGCAANTNLVENGSFETPEVESPTGVDFVRSFNGWNLSKGYLMEVDRDIFGASNAKDGKQYVELDSLDQVTQIYQDIPTEAGQTYKLNFAFSPRPDVSENKLNVRWGETLVCQEEKSGEGLTKNEWDVYTYDLEATSATTRLSFDNLNETPDSLGTYIDEISVCGETTSP